MTAHVDFDALAAYWLDDDGAEAVEDHVFSCARCAGVLDDVRATADALRGAGAALASPILPRALMDRLARDGARVRAFTVRDREVVPCAVGDTDDLFVAHLVGDFRGAGRLDLVIDVGDAQERYEDVAVNRAQGEIHVAEQGDVVRTWPATRLVFRAFDVTNEGERLLATFVLDHHA